MAAVARHRKKATLIMALSSSGVPCAPGVDVMVWTRPGDELGREVLTQNRNSGPEEIGVI